MTEEKIRKNVQSILKGLKPGIAILAATKTRTIDEIKEAVDSGIRIVGENKVQEAEKKYSELSVFFKKNNVEFHLIGTLQKNKVKKAVQIFDMIQSLDSQELAVQINKRAKEINKKQRVLVEVNIAGEDKKGGVSKEKLLEFLKTISTYPNIHIKGLMCIPPITDNPENSREYFKEMKNLFDEIKKMKIINIEMRYLSIGMTYDYLVAIEEGSSMVRIGTGIFGERKH
jgi:pyridoxal phosphate enzyme (YggS family)